MKLHLTFFFLKFILYVFYLQELERRSEKISEMTAVMKKAVEIDDENFSKEQEKINRLISQNNLIRDVLELNQIRSELAQKSALKRTDESVQTDL